jgi:serine/threonine protein kinase
MVVCDEEVDAVEVTDNLYKPSPQAGLPELSVCLNSLHCVDGSLAPLKAPLDAKAVFSSRGPRILITIQAEGESLVGFRPPAPDTCIGASNDSADAKLNVAKLEVAIRLPLLFAAARVIGREFVQDRYIIALILPELDVVPTALRPDSQCLIPSACDGVWMLECDTEAELERLADALQDAGCAMQGFEDRYEVGEMLGVGSFSKVFWAEDRRTGLPVAAKIVPKGGMSKDKLLMKEVCVLRHASHPSVLDFRGFFEAFDPEDQVGVWVIVTELVAGGELFERVRQNGRYPEERAAYIAYQLLSALKALHERRLVHRDIKTENVILVEDDTDEIKLVDFGLATPEWDTEAMSVRCGSPGYIAPEVLRNEKYGCKVDCFSVGVLLHILLVGRGPFRGKSTEEMLTRNLKCKVSHRPLAHISADGKDLLLSLLDPQPDQRPSSAEALEHRWLQQHMQDGKFPKAVADRIDSKVSTAAETAADFQELFKDQFDGCKAFEPSFHSMCVEMGHGRSTRDVSDSVFMNERAMTLQSRRDASLSAFFTGDDENDPRFQKEPTSNEEADAKNEDDDDVEDFANMPPLRTQTAVWSEVQHTISLMRLKGFSPRQTLESYRKSRSSWGDGRVSGHGRPTGRLTRELFDLERNTFYAEEELKTRQSFSESGGAQSPGILRELAKSDVRMSSGDNVSNMGDNNIMSTNPQDVLTELKADSGVADKGSRTAMVRGRSRSKESAEAPNASSSDSCASGSGSTAVRSLRQQREAEANKMDLMSEASCEIVKPAQGPGENRFCRIRSLRSKTPVTGPDPSELTDLDCPEDPSTKQQRRVPLEVKAEEAGSELGQSSATEEQSSKAKEMDIELTPTSPTLGVPQRHRPKKFKQPLAFISSSDMSVDGATRDESPRGRGRGTWDLVPEEGMHKDVDCNIDG